MNRLILTSVCACLCLLAVTSGLHAQNNVIDEVVWVVGDAAILKSDVENERLSIQYEGRRLDGDPYCVIPEQLAVQKLFLHQAEIDSVTVTDQEVLQGVEAQMAWLIDQIGSKEKLEAKLLRRYAKCCARIFATERQYSRCSRRLWVISSLLRRR